MNRSIQSHLRHLVFRFDNLRHWLNATIAFCFLNVLKLFPADPAIRFADRFARLVGPLTPRHKLVLQNLALAYPEKPERERREIATASWGHIGRLAAEYVFLDQLFDYDPERSEPRRIEVSGIDEFTVLYDHKRPFIVFTARGQFRTIGRRWGQFGLNVTSLFRPPNNPYVAGKSSTLETRGWAILFLPMLGRLSRSLANWSAVVALESSSIRGFVRSADQILW
jgi:KDO2-lipid IV(A) lauroyltransferase